MTNTRNSTNIIKLFLLSLALIFFNFGKIFAADDSVMIPLGDGNVAHIQADSSYEPSEYDKNTKIDINDPLLNDIFTKYSGSSNVYLKDLKGIKDLKIHNIAKTGNKVKNIDCFKYMENLTNLYMTETAQTDLSPLKDLKKLKEIRLDKNKSTFSLEPISNLDNLEILRIIAPSNLVDGEFVSEPNINDSDIKYISKLNNLQYLQLRFQNLNNVDSLSTNKLLKQIDISYSNLSDISFISELKDLYYIEFDDNNIEKVPDLKNVVGKNDITNFIYISFMDNKISDINFLDFVNDSSIWNSDKEKNKIIVNLDSNKIKDPSMFKNIDFYNNIYSCFNVSMYNQKYNHDKVIKNNNIFDIDLPVRYINNSFPTQFADSYFGILDNNDFNAKYDEDKKVISVDSKVDSSTLKYELFNYEFLEIEAVQLLDPLKFIQIESGMGITYFGEHIQDFEIVKEPDNPGDGGGGGTVNPPTKRATAILANGKKYTDVLTATVLANERDCPILLTDTNDITTETFNELKRRGIGDVIISGGLDSVSQKVVDQLKDFNVIRYAGSDRYGTAREIGKEVRALTGKTDGAMLVDGTNFPDVITISALATQKRVPILITNPNKLTTTTE
ncbi:cell wall-binding repeat-containing protein, partial [Peptostreptococcus faecalis]|uniref:cell wall-binding repeat-containing protein n=1 Tax=Peptostreptococcus faecalis TaxID=2045015 RepID=UPI0011AF0A66